MNQKQLKYLQSKIGYQVTADVESSVDFILAQQREELLDLVEKEVIGEDEKQAGEFDFLGPEAIRNNRRVEQRLKLQALRKEGGGKV